MTTRLKREKAIKALLRRTREELKRIEIAYRFYIGSGGSRADVPESLKIDIHDFLAHGKAILDYLAQEIADLCYPRPRKPYFPIAAREKPLSEFEIDLERWFPKLHERAPELFQYLVEIQHYHDSPWLLELREIVNFCKHDNLPPQSRSEFVSLIVYFRGTGLRVGELGLQSIHIQPGAKLVLRAPDGEERAIRGPQVIDVNTTHLQDADPDIVIQKVRWTDFKIPPSERSAVGLLRIIGINIERVYERVAILVTKYREQTDG